MDLGLATVGRRRPRRRSAEQRAAVQAIHVLAKPYRFRIDLDIEGCPAIPGRYGQIEWFDTGELAVYTDHPRLFAKLWTIPGLTRHQAGDAELRTVFPPEAFGQVAAVIKARRRRVLAREEAGRLGAKTVYRATSGG
jgi:hypothetical protein